MKSDHHVCPWWLAYCFDNPARRLFHNPQKILSPYVHPGMDVADIGCGMGYFSIGLAEIVGEGGKVYSVDIQQEMLDILMKRAGRKKVDHLIHPRIAKPDHLNITTRFDFVLASWMVHETRDIPAFLMGIHDRLKRGGIFYMLEPRLHVTPNQFAGEVATAIKCSFQLIAKPKVAFSRTAVFKKR